MNMACRCLIFAFVIIVVGVFDQAINLTSGSGVGSVEERLKDLETKISKISQIENENKILKDRLDLQEKHLQFISDENNYLKNRLKEHERKRQTRISNGDNLAIEEKGVRSETKQMAPDAVTSVAFATQTDSTLNYSIPDTVVFGYVQMNEGGGYDSKSGLFTCPKSGLYLFSYDILSIGHDYDDGGDAGVMLMVGGLPILMSGESAPGQDKSYNIQGTSVVRLETGDHVWLSVAANHTTVYMYGSNFAGARIGD